MRRAILLSLLLLLQSACAESYFSGYLGGASTQNSFLRIREGTTTDLRLNDVAFTGRSWESPLYYGIRHGFFFYRFIGLETEFNHLKVFTDPSRPVSAQGTVAGTPVSGTVPLSTYVQRFNISHGVNVLTENLVLRKQFMTEPDRKLGRVLVTGRVGFGISVPHPEYQVFNGMVLEHYDAGKLAWQLAGGAEYRLWKGLYALGEYKFTHARMVLHLIPSTAETVLKSNHGVFGLAVHF